MPRALESKHEPKPKKLALKNNNRPNRTLINNPTRNLGQPRPRLHPHKTSRNIIRLVSNKKRPNNK